MSAAVVPQPVLSSLLPAGVERAGENARKRFFDFFTADKRNPNTRRAYARVVAEFFPWCEARGVRELAGIETIHISAWVEHLLQQKQSKPTVKQKLAAVRMLFGWLVVKQVVLSDPALDVRGPKYSIKRRKTRVLTAEEARELLDIIDTSTVVGLCDSSAHRRNGVHVRARRSGNQHVR